MIDSLVDIVRRIAKNEVKKLHILELAVVTSVFPHSSDQDKDNYECSVRLKDKDVELRKVPVATQHIGLANPVHAGDLVLVSFIDGDINSPVILGRLYNDEDRPPINKIEEIIYKPAYSTNTELRRLNIVLPGGVNVTLNDDKISLIVGQASVVANANGDILVCSTDNEGTNNRSEITMNKSGEFAIRTDNMNNICEIKLDDSGILVNTDFDINLKSKGNITLECEMGNLKLKAPNIIIDSQLSGKISAGTTLDIESNATANIKSTGPMAIKGAIVNIN